MNVSMMTSVDIGDKVVLGLNVEDIVASIQRFGWPDYLVFLIMLLLGVVIGLYFSYFHASVNTQDYLMGGRTMKVFPVSMSLIASFLGGISLLGIPTEIYVYGIQYFYILFGVFIMTFVMSYVYLPVFHELHVTSTYEYLGRRFDKKVRILGSVLFSIEIARESFSQKILCHSSAAIMLGNMGADLVTVKQIDAWKLFSEQKTTYIEDFIFHTVAEKIVYITRPLLWLPVVIYVPALAFNQVTGVNVHLTTPIVCVICIFYTSVGGLKAVVWTDVIQTIIMFGAMLLIAIKGTLGIGGLKTVWQTNWESGRIEGPNLQFDLLSRHTVWSFVIGGFVYLLQTAAVNQAVIQRYLSLPTLNAARKSLWLFFAGIFVIISLCSYNGLLIYAIYSKCDPLTTMLAKEKDQLLPLMVMKILGDYPGLPGLFVAGIFSAALSSLSSGFNSMAAIILEDFYKSIFAKQLSEKKTSILMKLSVVFLGCVCVGMVFVVEKLGTVLQLTMSVGAITSGASLGLFTMGILLPWINAKGALAGGISSLGFMIWLCMRTQAAIASEDLSFPEKPVTTDGCRFTANQSLALNVHLDPSINVTDVTHTDERFMMYRLSYLWYTLIGATVAIIIGLLISVCTKPLNPCDVDPMLLAPFVRKLIKPRKFPNETGDGIIYAYGSAKNDIAEKIKSKATDDNADMFK